MKTPIADFARQYANSGFSRLHMPGHKGQNLSGCEKFDITEIKNADALYEAQGIIKESENNASALFGTGQTLYSTEGSTQCIKAMLFLIKLRCRSKKCTVAASRNSHKAFIYGCALLDIDIKWLWDDGDFSRCRCGLTASSLAEQLDSFSEQIDAVYVTSPDYAGGELAVADLARTAHTRGIPLIVDNAHGAYLHFLRSSRHPIDLGADMCCDSAHKTLPVLTGGAYLHLAKGADELFFQNAKRAMEMFGSTSPSYLILRSLDMANRYLCENYKEKLQRCVARIDELKSLLISRGYTVFLSDPLRLTIGSTGDSIAEKLRKYRVEVEYEDPDFTVLMFTTENYEEDFLRIEKALSGVDNSREPMKFLFTPPEKVLSVREAVFSQNEEIGIADAAGRICAMPTVSCPPAVPIVVSGERIESSHIKIFEYYGTEKVCVVKN